MDGYIDIVILIDTHEINSEGDSLMSKNKTVKKEKEAIHCSIAYTFSHLWWPEKASLRR